MPQLRDERFSTEIFSRYQRSEQALVLSLMEMVLNGVSTRKVTKITEELCGASFSKSTVSQLCLALDGRRIRSVQLSVSNIEKKDEPLPRSFMSASGG